MNGKQLKNSLLQWAIQGKLVPQYESEEPAIELLKRINPKFVQPKYDEELPKGWSVTTLSSVASIYTGNSINEQEKKIKYTGLTEGYNYIATKDLGFNQSIDYENGIKIPFKTNFRIAKSGSILLCIEGGSAGRKIGILTQDVCFVNKLCAFESIGLYNRYLYYYLQSPNFKSIFIDKTSGLIGGVSQKNLRTILIPIPPLVEQKRIVAKIDELMPLVERYTKAQEDLDKLNTGIKGKLRASILQEAIQGKLVPQDANEEPAIELLKRINPKYTLIEKEEELPDGWCWCKINDYVKLVTDFVASGSFASLRENVKYYKEENYAILVRTLDLQNNFTKSKVYTDKHGYDFLNNSNLEGGELILPNVGSIGKVFLVPKLDKRMTLAPNSIMLRFHNESHIAWFYYLFSSLYGQDLIHTITSKTAQPKFNKTSFRNLTVPLPPLAEQKRIVEKLEALFSTLDTIESNLD